MKTSHTYYNIMHPQTLPAQSTIHIYQELSNRTYILAQGIPRGS